MHRLGGLRVSQCKFQPPHPEIGVPTSFRRRLRTRPPGRIQGLLILFLNAAPGHEFLYAEPGEELYPLLGRIRL
jgi:hypothetical protein